MNFVDKEMRRAAMEKAVLLPSLIDGEKLKRPRHEIRLRPTGYWALFADGVYVRTTGEKDEAAARRWLEVFELQREAEEDGMLDVRRASTTAIVESRKKAVDRKKLAGAAVIKSTLKAIEPHLEGRQLRHLTDDWVEETEDAMAAAGYSYEYFCNGVRYLRTAIRAYTKKRFGAVFLPFDMPPEAPGRVRVLAAVERDVALRWSAGTEAYDPGTGLWTPQAALSAMELRDRRLTYRELYLGTAFGSRPGVYEKLAWEPHAEGGHFNLEEALFHRVPPGTRTAANKLAPPVAMPDEVVAELRRWREQDAGNRWLFRTLDGEPLGYDFQAVVFARCMAALGIENVTGHVLRHTCITRLVEKGVPPRVISAVCGISVRMLHRRYDHADDRVLQVLAHGAMVSMLG